jgi:hypothetical protein
MNGLCTINARSFLPAGSGAVVVHGALQHAIAGYSLTTYPPAWEYWPFRMRRLRDPAADVVHAPPDHAVFVCPQRTPLVITFHNYVLDAAMRPFSSLCTLRLRYRSAPYRWLEPLVSG